MKDLVVLVADKDLKSALEGVFSRNLALGIRQIDVDIWIEPTHDPGCFRNGADFLSNFTRQYRHAILMFDYEGSGRERTSIDNLRNELNCKLGRWWGDKAKAIILNPELEIWVWSDSPHVDEILGWKDRTPALREWLIREGWLKKRALKPDRPKEAFEAALREAQTPKSSSLFRQLAERVSFERCVDSAFNELKIVLREWFPAEVE